MPLRRAWLAVLLAACSGGSNPRFIVLDAGPDLAAVGSPDLGGAPDLATAVPDLATTPPDLTAPPDDLRPQNDIRAALACTRPADCGGNPCCIHIVQLLFAGANCTAAMNACVPKYDVQTLNIDTRACTSNADCTAGGVVTDLNLCCLATQGGLVVKMCANKFIEQGAMGQVLCP